MTVARIMLKIFLITCLYAPGDLLGFRRRISGEVPLSLPFKLRRHLRWLVASFLLLSLATSCIGDPPARYIYSGYEYDASCTKVPPSRLGAPIQLDEGPYAVGARAIEGISEREAIALKFQSAPCQGPDAEDWLLYTSLTLTIVDERELIDGLTSPET